MRIAGDRADASYAGYAWVEASPSDPVRGHVSLLWSMLDVAAANQRSEYEWGAKVRRALWPGSPCTAQLRLGALCSGPCITDVQKYNTLPCALYRCSLLHAL